MISANRKVDGRRLLVTRVVGPEVIPLAWHALHDVTTDLVNGDVDHVQSHRVTGREHELGEHASPEDMGYKLDEATVGGRLGCHGRQLRKMLPEPVRERDRFARVGEDEAWRDVQSIAQNIGIGTTRLSDRAHPVLIGGYEGSFRRREWHVVRPVRIRSVHTNRSRDAKRDMSRAHEVLDAATHLLCRERHVSGGVHRMPGVVGEPRASHRRVGTHNL